MGQICHADAKIRCPVYAMAMIRRLQEVTVSTLLGLDEKESEVYRFLVAQAQSTLDEMVAHQIGRAHV